MIIGTRSKRLADQLNYTACQPKTVVNINIIIYMWCVTCYAKT